MGYWEDLIKDGDYRPDGNGWVSEEAHAKALETIDELRDELERINRVITKAMSSGIDSLNLLTAIKREIYYHLDETEGFTDEA